MSKELDTKVIKSKHTLNDFTQTIINKNKREMKVFDFDKIDKTPFGLILIVSQRGLLGKTYNIKDKMRNDYLRYGRKSMFMRNLKDDLATEQKKFLSSEDTPPNYANTAFSGSVKKNTLWLKDTNTNEEFIRFSALNTGEKEKGSRVRYKQIVIDEFNVGTNMVQDYINKFDSVLHSTEDIVNDYGVENDEKIYLFGNNKTLNHPLIVALGILSIKQEITELYLNNQPLMLIIWPAMSSEEKEKFEEDNKTNKRFLISKLLGTAEHSYFNESLYDIDNFVENKLFKFNKLSEQDKSLNINDYFNLKLSVFHKDQYYNVYAVSNDLKVEIPTLFHITKVEKQDVLKFEGKNVLVAFKSNDKSEGVRTLTSTKHKEKLSKALASCQLSFEDIVSRELFVSSIK